MKKLFLLAATSIMLLSCQNGSDEFVQTPVGVEKISSKAVTAKDAPLWDKPSEDPYALDGYIHITRNFAVYMGEELKPDNSEEAKEALRLYNEADQSRRAFVYCLAQFDGFTIALVETSGYPGQPRAYWLVYTYADGSQTIQSNPRPSMGDCGILHFNSWIY